MNYLTVSGLSKSFGSDTVFSDVSFEIYSGDRVGLVGVNGCGKTTLIKILCGIEGSDKGDVIKGKQTVLGYMEQHVCSDNEITAYDEVLTAFDSIREKEKELERTEFMLRRSQGDESRLIEKQVALHEEIEREGGLTYKNRAKSALAGLGFSENDMNQKVGTLSGGQRAKLQLAKMLLSGANLLLLDEPTNHLDIKAVEWLEDFLKDYKGTFIVISHDRYFLDKVTNKTFTIRQGKFFSYSGNYSVFLEQQAQYDLTMKRKFDNTQKEIERLEKVVERQRQWNREKSIKQAESKLKMIDRLKDTLEAPVKEDESISFSFHASRRSGDDVLSVKGLALSYDEKALFSGANMELKRGDHAFLIGPNGCGKTSFLKVLLGYTEAQKGEISFGAGVETGYYDQIQTSLNSEKDVLNEIWDEYPEKTETEIRNALALFLFKGEDVYKKISALSGGERARVLLLKLMFSKANFLLLDEPTNHLDIFSCDALEEALRSYDGTLLIVSHDRYLINRTADKIFSFENGKLCFYSGNYDDYIEKRKSAEPAEKDEPAQKISENKILRELEAKLKKSRIRLKRLENEIEEKEEETQKLKASLEDPEISGDYIKVTEISEKLKTLSEQTEELMILWSDASEETEVLLSELKTP